LTNGTTYYYKVNYNVNGAGASLYSGPVSATPAAPLATIEVTPASASIQTGQTQQFTAVGKDAAGNALVPQPTFDWSVAGGGSIDSSGLFSATTAGGPFTVTAASGSASGTASVTVADSVPGAPSNLAATWATMLNGWFKLTWTDNATNETGFTIQSYNGSAWSTYATVAADATTYTRTGLNMPSGPYTLRVVANGSAGNSSPSNQVTFSIPAAPAGPSGLTAVPGNTQVVVSWTEVPGASNYNVQRATASAGPYTVIKYNNLGTSYTSTGLANGTTYYYKVNYNVNGVGASLYSGPVAAMPN
jgi:titin